MILRDLVTRFGADTAGFTKGTSEIKNALKSLNRDFNDNKAVMKETSAELKNLEKEQQNLQERIASMNETELEEYRAQLDPDIMGFYGEEAGEDGSNEETDTL